MRTLWGGAFEESTSELVERFGQSIASDLEFWQEDVVGSVAHARMLGAEGIIGADEAEALIRGLERIHEEGPEGLPANAEDIHTAIEARLGEIVGEVAGKLHAGRSRNDQVATGVRLYIHNQLSEVQDRIKRLQRLLAGLAARHRDSLMPGYTHQQRAQPITLGLHLLAHFWALQRHGWRGERLLELSNYCPLGAAALAGTSLPISRQMTARELGFTAPIPNALDAISDRSFVLDALHLCALIMLDLSRLSQELVMWSGHEYGFVRLSDSVTTGSSIMPQKRNPDMAELIRGRSARAIGNWTALAAAMKGLPLGYNRDTQDDKPPLFDSLRLVKDGLDLARLMLESAEWQTDRMAEATRGDFSTATDLADILSQTGMPFRRAHEAAGRAVRACVERGLALDALSPEELRGLVPELPEAFEPDALSASASVRRRESLGGPGPRAMRAQLDHAELMLAAAGFPKIC